MSGEEEDREDTMQTEETDKEVENDATVEKSTMEDESDSDVEGASSWPDDKTAKLIELWKERGALYDPNHKHYRNRPKKQKAMNQICTALNVTRMYLNKEKSRSNNNIFTH